MPTSSKTLADVETENQTDETKKDWNRTCPGSWTDSETFEKDDLLCHGQFDCMRSASTPIFLGFVFKIFGTLKNALWHLKSVGFIATLEYALFKALKAAGANERAKSLKAKKKKGLVCDEVLNLKPGELVEVKSQEEIWVTLDMRRRYKGMYFMRGMQEFCGKRLRVYKRVKRILLESNGELRMIKNTVLLQGAICDGQERCSCDRSCFYYWKEAWLRRVEESNDVNELQTTDGCIIEQILRGNLNHPPSNNPTNN